MKGKNFPTLPDMGTLHRAGNWLVKVQGNEHPPVHVHILHPDGRASIGLEGSVLNRGIPASIIAQALAWVADNQTLIRAEWERMHNSPERSTST